MPFVARPAALVFLLAAIALAQGALAPGAQAQGQTQAKPAIPADAPIRRVALIPCPEPTEFAAITQQSGLIWAIINADNNEKMTAAMTADQVRIGERITAEVEAQLRAANFEVVRLPPSNRDKPNKLLDRYDAITVDADVILEIVVRHLGYFRPSIIWDYGPGVRIDTRLVVAADKRRLSTDDFGYARALRFSETESYDKRFKFADMDVLRANLPVAREGLESGAEPLAREVVAKIAEINAKGGTAAAASDSTFETTSDPDKRKDADTRSSN